MVEQMFSHLIIGQHPVGKAFKY